MIHGPVRPARGLIPLLLLLATAPASLAAQWLEIRPTATLDGGPTVGVRVTSALSRARDLIGPYPRGWHLATRADIPVYLDSKRNPETLRTALDAGFLISLFRPSTPVGAVPSPDDPEPWNAGFVVAQLTFGAEAPQDLATADLTLGVSVAYGHDQDHLWFVPEVRGGWDAVICLECDPASGEAENGSRWNAEVGWDIPADHSWVPSALRPFLVRLRGRAFAASGLSGLERLRGDNGLWGSAELAYRCDSCGPVHELYVRGSAGQMPIELLEERTVTAGVSLAF